jgi:hypothetical protein
MRSLKFGNFSFKLFQEKMYWVILKKFHKTSKFCKMFLMNEPCEADNKQTRTGILITHILFNIFRLSYSRVFGTLVDSGF